MGESFLNLLFERDNVRGLEATNIFEYSWKLRSKGIPEPNIGRGYKR